MVKKILILLVAFIVNVSFNISEKGVELQCATRAFAQFDESEGYDYLGEVIDSFTEDDLGLPGWSLEITDEGWQIWYHDIDGDGTVDEIFYVQLEEDENNYETDPSEELPEEPRDDPPGDTDIEEVNNADEGGGNQGNPDTIPKQDTTKVKPNLPCEKKVREEIENYIFALSQTFANKREHAIISYSQNDGELLYEGVDGPIGQREITFGPDTSILRDIDLYAVLHTHYDNKQALFSFADIIGYYYFQKYNPVDGFLYGVLIPQKDSYNVYFLEVIDKKEFLKWVQNVGLKIGVELFNAHTNHGMNFSDVIRFYNKIGLSIFGHTFIMGSSVNSHVYNQLDENGRPINCEEY